MSTETPLPPDGEHVERRNPASGTSGHPETAEGAQGASPPAVEGLDLDGLRAKAEAAVKASGPGWYEPGSDFIVNAFWGGADGDYVIAASPERVLALIARVEAAEAAVDRVRRLGHRAGIMRVQISGGQVIDALDGAS